MQRSASSKFITTTVATVLLMAGLMVALRFAVPAPAAEPDTLANMTSVSCSFTPDAENIAYQSEMYGVSLTAAEATTIHTGLFLDDQPRVNTNVTTTSGVRNVAFVSQHGAIIIFDTSTGEPLPAGMPLLSPAC